MDNRLPMKKIWRLVALNALLFSGLNVFAQTTCEDLWIERCRLFEEIRQEKSPAVRLQKYQALKNVLEIAEAHGCGMDKGGKDIAAVNKQIQELSGTKSSDKTGTNYTWPADAGVYAISVKKIKNPILDICPEWMVKCSHSLDSIWFEVQKNESTDSRKGVIRIISMGKAKEIRVTQSAAKPFAFITDSVGFSFNGGEAPIFVETNETSWTIDNPAKWLKVKKTDFGATVTCDANPSQKEKTAVLTFTLGNKKLKKKVCIIQYDREAVFIIPQQVISFECVGGQNDTVWVESNYGQWTARTNNDWLNVGRKYGGIIINCAANYCADEREGIVFIESGNPNNDYQKIVVKQKGNTPYLNVTKPIYKMAGNEWTVTISVNTNMANWTISPAVGNDWCTVKKVDANTAQVTVLKNNTFHQRIDSVVFEGNGVRTNVVFSQLHRGYKGFYKDYYDSRPGNFRLEWVNLDLSGLLTLGLNVAVCPVRWKPVELSLVNFNVDFFMDNRISAAWEPIVRGYHPITRDGKWAGYIGFGAHVSMTRSWSYFLFEAGVDVNWNDKLSSRIFFKYNGASTFGMSLDLGGKWF